MVEILDALAEDPNWPLNNKNYILGVSCSAPGARKSFNKKNRKLIFEGEIQNKKQKGDRCLSGKAMPSLGNGGMIVGDVEHL